MTTKTNRSIAHHGPLGGKVTKRGDRDYSPEAIKNELKEKGLRPVEHVKIKNSVTGKTTALTIRRDGTNESNLMLALADENLTRDQKDTALSMYLFERGKENASFMLDLYKYKGQHSKETRAFKSQMRFDFEMFVTVFTEYLDSSAKAIFKELNYLDRNDYTVPNFVRDYHAYLKEGREDTSVFAFMRYLSYPVSQEKASLIQIAVRMFDEAETLRNTTKKMTEARMKDKGFGIYLDTSGQPYSIFNEKEPLEDIIKADRARIEELKKENNL